MKLLIVEDNPEMRRLLRLVVADLAEEVTECGDGDEAVAAYLARQLGRSDWVLVDLQMPRVGGIEATRRLLQADSEARVVIVTQYDDTHWREAARGAGACGYVLKENLLELRGILQSAAAKESDQRSFMNEE